MLSSLGLQLTTILVDESVDIWFIKYQKMVKNVALCFPKSLSTVQTYLKMGSDTFLEKKITQTK